MIQVVLIEPEIPQNTGNIARTCAATRTPLHLVEPLGFHITDRHLKRAGLDYWRHVSLMVHSDIHSLRAVLCGMRWVFFSSRATRPYHEYAFREGDCLIFGPETRGLPEDLIQSSPDHVLSIPIDRTRVRSLNLATTVGVALFEALRQVSPRGWVEHREGGHCADPLLTGGNGH
jgi:tRNA (cytidine/uridine-2'-O-)-methyltransferase